MTEFVFKYIRKNRKLFLELVNSLSIEQLNKIPDGYRNNIAWNFGHIVVTTQILCYTRSGVKPDMNVHYAEKYQRNTKPETFISQEEIDELKQSLLSSINKIETDAKQNVFANIKPFSTMTYGYEMTDINEVLTCSLAHDAMHYGVALSQRKLV